MTEWLSIFAESVAPMTWKEIGTGMLCGAILGFERQLLGKPAGVRTSILICLGTYIFVKLGAFVHHEDLTATARIIGQVITGVGFLGAGVILNREGIVHGVTSAAVIWILAAIGVIIGTGFCISAIIITLLTVFVLTSVDLLERFAPFRRGVHSQRVRNGDNGDFGK